MARRIRLDQALVTRGLCDSRERAKRSIMAGDVRVNGHPATKASDPVAEEDVVELAAREKFVSRGGLKLEHALQDFSFEPPMSTADVKAQSPLRIANRIRRTLFAGVGLVILVIASAIVVAHWQSREQPHVSVTVLSYTNVVFSTNNLYAGKWIRATLELTNQGLASVSYLSWEYCPYGSVTVETSEGWTNRHLAPPFTGGFTLVRPKSSVRFSTLLPADSKRWKFGFQARTASARERANWKLFETGWMDHLGDFNNWWVWILPDKPGPTQNFQSEEIEIR